MKYLCIGLKLACLFFLLGASACGCGYNIGEEEYREFVKAPDINKTEAQQRFSSYSIEKQIDIYLYARNCPNNPQIKQFLVNNGENKIPLIVERIKKEERAWNKVYLLEILSSINMNCKCIGKDSLIIKSLEIIEKDLYDEKSVHENLDTYKKMYSDELKFLKEQSASIKQ